MHSCARCGMAFAQAQGLTRHLARKFPCIERGDTKELRACNLCTLCGQAYSTAGNLERHKKKVCLRKQAVAPMTTTTTVDPLVEMQTRIASLERIISEQKQQPIVNYAAISTGIPSNATNNNMVVNNIGGTVSNIVNVNHVTIAPWGSPLQLTDADVEAALASIPSLAGTPALPEVVAALMELVKRAHVQPAARNIHLNPKRADQALALTAGGWATLQLSEATGVLFDAASAQIGRRPAGAPNAAMRAALPAQYRVDKETAVALGLRPMEAHLANTRPGGPGPLMLEHAESNFDKSKFAEPAAPAAPATAAVPASSQEQHIERVVAVLKTHPLRCSASGALLVDWIVAASQAAGLSGRELFKALEAGSKCGELTDAWRAAQRFTEEKMRPRATMP